MRTGAAAHVLVRSEFSADVQMRRFEALYLNLTGTESFA